MSQEREGSQGERTHFKVGSIIPEARGLDRIDVKKLTKEPSGISVPRKADGKVDSHQVQG